MHFKSKYLSIFCFTLLNQPCFQLEGLLSNNSCFTFPTLFIISRGWPFFTCLKKRDNHSKGYSCIECSALCMRCLFFFSLFHSRHASNRFKSRSIESKSLTEFHSLRKLFSDVVGFLRSTDFCFRTSGLRTSLLLNFDQYWVRLLIVMPDGIYISVSLQAHFNLTEAFLPLLWKMFLLAKPGYRFPTIGRFS